MSDEHDPARAEGDDEDLSTLFRAMRDDHVPDDLEEKLLTAVAVGSAAWVVKSGFFASLFAKLLAATKGSTAATVIGVGFAAAGSLAAVQMIATQTAPRSVASAPRVAQQVSPASPSAARSLTGAAQIPSADVAASPTTSGAPAFSAAPPAAPSPPLVPAARAASASREPSARIEPAPAVAAPVESVVAPTRDALREEASRVRTVADLVATGRCAEALAAIQTYRTTFPRGQLAEEMRVLEGRCSAAK